MNWHFLLSYFLLILSRFQSVAVVSQLNHTISNKKPFSSLEFSGIYTPNIRFGLEVYSAAWLQKVSRFLTVTPHIEVMNALESSTHGALFKYSFQNTQFAAMTRDYFDFFVEHLSSTTNQISEEPHLVEYLTHQLQEKVIFLKKSMKLSSVVRPLTSSTVVIIPYSCKSASQGGDMDRIKELRLLFFQATFWSIYRYFRHIMVYVSSTEDYQTLVNLKLPYDTLIQSEKDFQLSWELPRYSLLHATDSLLKNVSWSHFSYIYFTEADQILTMREQRTITQWLNYSDEGFALVPHRMISMIFPPTLPSHLHSYLDPWRFNACCDVGRWKFPDCDTWWYDCSRGWGLNNITSWFRHGKTGFTMLTGTEHGGRCAYTPTRELCPVPRTCRKRVPFRIEEICEEIPLINEITK